MASDLDNAERPKDEAGGADRASYSSVVYFHGMGSQRRYEETSRLIDCLDRFLVGQHRAGNSLGMLRNIRVRVEPLRSAQASSDIVGYIRTVFAAGPQVQEAISVRFYEVYWAPIMAGNKSPWGVTKWLFKQPLRPWRTLRSPWRERQRLRRASLAALFERKHARSPVEIEERDYARLISLYDDFEGLEAQRRFPEGSFDEFLSFVAEEAKSRPETAKRLEVLARAWYAAYRSEELRNAAILAIMALALVLLAGATLFGVLIVLQSMLAFRPLADVLTQLGAPLKADWKTVVAIAASLAGLVGIGRFLTDYLGDVEAWATYEETDIKHMARNKVLDQSLELLTHVLGDPACERVTVVAHSLGTSVAHDALLALTRRNRAFKPEDPIAGPVPMNKIEHFVTMGSPIDKIEYFFESYSSPSHRYKRVVEALRGDIGAPPFTRNRHPYIHWINFWDQGDAISGALHSPASAVDFSQRVDNVHVANFGFPDPGASHGGYFNNRTVIDALFRIIYRRDGSFRTLTQPDPGKPYDYESVYQGPGEPLGTRSVYALLAFATPLLVVVGLVAWLFNLRMPGYGAWGLAALAVTALVGGYIASRLKGQRNAI
ncbi:hypothetical protein KMZ93_16995 [Bradyrhizobium sediminis]|uniref:Alpha/beta hydrolase n=1 Tax=Bradyrhizobium sediminis TaxID=2840469 RepID=A0A975RV24_9BRAD|nr:hypothetical protein [Bradyrhizobium sediminis]QWG21687.1 hypothetical protein KMZ93_16995 [Bradyrhizobium sediminis]